MSEFLALSFRTFIQPEKKTLLGFHPRFVPEKAFNFPPMTWNLNIKHTRATGQKRTESDGN